MIRTLFWVALWVASLCSLKIHVLYCDGLEITLNPWWKWGKKEREP